jgi:hypothetical protein
MGWKVEYVANTLESKYGILGKVAARYVRAGFSVKVGNVFITARKGSSGYLIAVAVNPKEARTKFERLKEAATKSGLTPVLVLYGKGRFTRELVEELRSEGITIKRLRS